MGICTALLMALAINPMAEVAGPVRQALRLRFATPVSYGTVPRGVRQFSFWVSRSLRSRVLRPMPSARAASERLPP